MRIGINTLTSSNSATCFSTTSTIPVHTSYTTASTSYTTYSHTANSASSCTTIKLVAFQTMNLQVNPDEDEEAYLLRMNDWMDRHAFQEGVKVQHFCLTLVGKARLWYESIRPINIDWMGLQNLFRQQYSKIDNTREQLFHTWRSFHFNESTETLDSYVT